MSRPPKGEARRSLEAASYEPGAKNRAQKREWYRREMASAAGRRRLYDYINEWRRNRRIMDPEWAQRQRDIAKAKREAIRSDPVRRAAQLATSRRSQRAWRQYAREHPEDPRVIRWKALKRKHRIEALRRSPDLRRQMRARKRASYLRLRSNPEWVERRRKSSREYQRRKREAKRNGRPRIAAKMAGSAG